MNPDQNQPGQPAPTGEPTPTPEVPETPVQPDVPAQDPNVTPVEPTPVVDPATPESPADPAITTPEQAAAPSEPAQASPFFSAANTAPAGTPVAPVTDPAVAPAEPTPIIGAPLPSDPQPPKKGVNKKVFLFGGIGLVVLLAIVAVAIYFLFWAVRPQDYKDAATAVRELPTLESDSRSDLTDLISPSSSNTADEIQKAADKAAASMKAYDDAVKKFDGQRALHDGDLNKLYEAYKKDYQAYADFNHSFLDSAKIGRAAIATCNDANDKVNENKDATFDDYNNAFVTPCKAALDKAANVKDEDLKKVLAAYSTYLTDYTPIAEKQFNAIKAKNYSAYLATMTEAKPITDKFSDAIKAATDNIEKRYDATKGTTDSGNAFAKALTAKAN